MAQRNLGETAARIRAYFESLDPYTPDREKLYELFKEPLFAHREGLSEAEKRELALQQVVEIAKRGFLKISDVTNNPGRYLAITEVIGGCYGSTGIKAGVQFTLWGGSLALLGSKRHHDQFFPEFDELKWPGGFAMTELAHGSNVRALETTATYDAAAQEFVINTPDDMATKWWIGNTALHGRHVTVFADLIVSGKSHGIHALVVPIRGEDHQPLPGVFIGDCGPKHGLHGVDNGALKFKNVRIPRTNLLNKFADVSANGEYSSPIANPNKRFAAMLSALVGGRVGLCGGALNLMKLALITAIRYGHARKQFGPTRDNEIPIMEYPTHQHRLLPALAQWCGLEFARRYLVQRYTNRSDDDIGDVHVLASGLKAVTTWTAIQAVQTCRECCGGHGYSARNRFGEWHNNLDVFLTFEGDNTVLMQQVAQGLLAEYKSFFAEHPYTGVFLMLRDRMLDSLRERNPVATHRTAESHLLSDDFQMSAFEFRVKRLLLSLARKLRSLTGRLGPYRAWNECLLDVTQLAHAYMNKVILEQFQAAVHACKDDAARSVLHKLCHLYALHNIWADIGTFRQLELIKRRKAQAISNEVRNLCRELKDVSLEFVDAIAPPDHVVGTSLGTADMDYARHTLERVQFATARL